MLLVLLVPAMLLGEDDIANVEYLSPLEQQVVREINMARTRPDIYATFVEEWLMHLDGTVLKLPGRTAVQTQEGAGALREAIDYLQGIEPTHPLEPMKGMSQGARDHVNDIGPAGATGHEGSDGSYSGERINRYGKWRSFNAENICYGGDDARDMVMRLIIDDGVPGRGHRTNIFNGDYYVVGVAFGLHRTYDTVCVITFAADYWD